MNTHRTRIRGGTRLGLFSLALAAAFAACERPTQMTAPAELDPQFAPPPSLTTVIFNVTDATGNPVEGAIVSVYTGTGAATPPLRKTTGLAGSATYDVTSETNIGYAVRVHGTGADLFTKLAPREDLTISLLPASANKLNAMTCGMTGPVVLTGQSLVECIDNRYVAVPKSQRGPLVINVQLTDPGTKTYALKGLNNAMLSSAAVLLVEEVPKFYGWQGTPLEGVAPGFVLGAANGATVTLPNKPGRIEAKAKHGDVTVAASFTTDEVQNGNIYFAPQICANPVEQPNVPYAVERTGPFDPAFSFTGFKWAYAAKDGGTGSDGKPVALSKDLTAAAVIIDFVQSGGSKTIDVSVRQRSAGKTLTATASITCTGASCGSATYKIPGANPLQLQLTRQPVESGVANNRLILLVTGVDPAADLEWSAKTQGDQIPSPSKSQFEFFSSAFIQFYKDFTFCHPDHSFDKTFDINW